MKVHPRWSIALLSLVVSVGFVPTDAFADDTDYITLVSTPDGTTGANASSPWYGSLGINGAGTVVFTSDATNLPGGNGRYQAYVWTANSGVTLVSNVGTVTAPVGASSGIPWAELNDDGSVYFFSESPDLPGAGSTSHYYLWTATDGIVPTAKVESPWDSLEFDGYTTAPRINSSGAIAFGAMDTNLPGGTSDRLQIYVWTEADGVTLVSNVGTSEAPVGADGWSYRPAISDSGAVVFVSDATNLPGGGSGEGLGVFLWTPAGGVTRINGDLPVGGIGPFHGGVGPQISWDDVLFTSGRQVFRCRQGGEPTPIVSIYLPEELIELYGDGGFGDYRANGNGDIVFISYPVGGSYPQIYLWSPGYQWTPSSPAPTPTLGSTAPSRPPTSTGAPTSTDAPTSTATSPSTAAPTVTPAPTGAPEPDSDAGGLSTTTIIVLVGVGVVAVVGIAATLVVRSRRKTT